jgi:hypothetical protein
MDPAYADEKLTVQHIDEVARLEASIDSVAEGKLVTKLDWAILPLGRFCVLLIGLHALLG